MKNRAFTLLELLVVIIIIGILSSIVIVSMSGSTDSATIAKGKAYAQQVHALLGANAVGVWNFDEGSGITAYDISGYGNNGTLVKGSNGTGLDWVSSDIGGTALQFDGVDDYVLIINNRSFSLLEKGTIEIWIYPNIITDQIFFMYEWSYSDYIRLLLNASGIITFRQEVGDIAVISINSDYIIPAEKWCHLVIVQNEILSQMYINGLAQDHGGEINSSNWFIDSGINGNMYFSRSPWNFPFSGLIDGVRIYSAALPATEIQKHYVQGLRKLLTDQAITQTEYDQRMEEFKKSLVSNL